MFIYLIRHTRPDVADGVCYGQSDVALAKSFEAEKESVRRKLRSLAEPELVCSSPLLRCARLAAALAGSGVRIDDRLKEMAFGDWELEYWDNIERACLDEWASDFVRRAPPRGETLASLYRRVRMWIEDLLSQPFDPVAVVTHAGVIRCLHAWATGVSLAEVFDIRVDYGDVFKLEIPEARDNVTITRIWPGSSASGL